MQQTETDREATQTPTRRRILRGAIASVAGVGVVTGASSSATAGSVRTTRIVNPLDIQGYNYLFSVDREDVCYWVRDICVPVGVVNVAAGVGQRLSLWSIPGSLLVAAVFCGEATGGCYLYRKLNEADPGVAEWIHVYQRGYWAGKLAGGLFPRFLVAPSVGGAR